MRLARTTPLPALVALLASLALLTLAVTLCGTARAQSAPPEDLAQFPHTSVEITSGKQVSRFEVWVADTPQRDQQGLMFVRDLPAGRGMLFPQNPARSMSMWMKNTYIALDMVFIDGNGRISHIVEQAEPLSLTTIDSGGPVAAVLEIRGGEVARRGLKVGDRVTWKR